MRNDIAYKILGIKSSFDPKLEKIEAEIRREQLKALIPESLEYRRMKVSQYIPRCLR